MIKGAIFDVDGTLLDSMTMWRTFCSTFVRSFGKEPEDDLDEKVRYFTLRQTSEYLSERYGILTPDEVGELADIRTREFYTEKTEPKEGAVEFVRMLKASGVKMYLASATYKNLLEAALKRVGILDCFEGIITCPEVGAGKDKPDIFLEALKRLGTDLSETWVFEDALHAVKTAKACGFKVFGMYDVTEADHRAELEALCDIYTDSYIGRTLSDFE